MPHDRKRKAGARWKDLSSDFGASQTIKRRSDRWVERCLIDRLFEQLVEDADLEWLMLDSTISMLPVSRRKTGAESPGPGPLEGRFLDQAFRRHRCLRPPRRLLPGPGQENHRAKALDLIDGIKPGAVLADRAYDADRLMYVILDAGAEPVIPPRRHRKQQRAYDKASNRHQRGGG